MSSRERSADTSGIERLKQSLIANGFEIYRTDASSIVLAERVRMHLMESGVSLQLNSALRVSVRVRTQRSDFPGDESSAMLDRVRSAVAASAQDNGFEESSAGCRNIMHPAEAGTVLDVWHEVTFSKVIDEESLDDHLRWALALPRCVTNSGADA